MKLAVVRTSLASFTGDCPSQSSGTHPPTTRAHARSDDDNDDASDGYVKEDILRDYQGEAGNVHRLFGLSFAELTEFSRDQVAPQRKKERARSKGAGRAELEMDARVKTDIPEWLQVPAACAIAAPFRPDAVPPAGPRGAASGRRHRGGGAVDCLQPLRQGHEEGGSRVAQGEHGSRRRDGGANGSRLRHHRRFVQLILRLIRHEHLEIPFIWLYRRDDVQARSHDRGRTAGQR